MTLALLLFKFQFCILYIIVHILIMSKSSVNNLTKIMSQALSFKKPKNKAKKVVISVKKKNPKPPVKKPTRSRRKNFVVARPGQGLSEYAHCRLMPFNQLGTSHGIPDGSDTRRLVVDHRLVTTFTFGSSGIFNIAITPTLPNSIWVNTGSSVDTTWALNGQTYPNNNGIPAVFVPLCQPEWSGQLATNNNSTWDLNLASTLYSSSQFRIVTVGWSITYTGATTSNAGSLVISTQKLAFQPPAVFGGTTFSVYSSQSGTNTNYTANEVQFEAIHAVPTFGVANSSSKVLSLMSGAHGVLKHSTNDFKYRELSGLQSYLSYKLAPTYSMLMNTVPAPSSGTFAEGNSGLCLGIDPDWDSTVIQVAGGIPGQSFLLDTLYCIEYVPAPGSSVYALSQAGPKENLPDIARTNRMAQRIPVAEVGGANAAGSLTSNLAETILETVVPAPIARFAGNFSRRLMS